MEHTVLLVDDDESLLADLVRALHKQPYQVCTARNGEEAIRFLKTREIDVVVADERMPGMSGAELLAWAAENYPGVMRIMLTGYAETETAIRAINEAGVCRFFTKPCNEARLALSIYDAIGRKKSLEDDRQMLETSRRQLHELERHSLDFDFQARLISQDIQGAIERILECCRRLEEQSGERLDRESQTLLADARQAAADARRLASQLQEAALAQTS